MNSAQYAALQEELGKLGQMNDREKSIFELGFQNGRSYELRRKLGRTL